MPLVPPYSVLDPLHQVDPQFQVQWPVSDGRAHSASNEIADSIQFGNRQAHINTENSFQSSANRSTPLPGGMAAGAIPALAQAAVGAQGNWLNFISSGIQSGLNFDLQNRNLALRNEQFGKQFGLHQAQVEFGQSAWNKNFEFQRGFADRSLDFQQQLANRQTTLQENWLAFEKSSQDRAYAAAAQSGMASPFTGGFHTSQLGSFNRGTGATLNVGPRASRASIQGATFAV